MQKIVLIFRNVSMMFAALMLLNRCITGFFKILQYKLTFSKFLEYFEYLNQSVIDLQSAGLWCERVSIAMCHGRKLNSIVPISMLFAECWDYSVASMPVTFVQEIFQLKPVKEIHSSCSQTETEEMNSVEILLNIRKDVWLPQMCVRKQIFNIRGICGF